VFGSIVLGFESGVYVVGLVVPRRIQSGGLLMC